MLELLALKDLPEGLTVKVKVQPRAAKNEICGIMEDALRLRLTSPPVDGEANAACTAFLARFMGVAKSKVSILQGHASRIKTIKIEGISKTQFLDRLKTIIKD